METFLGGLDAMVADVFPGTLPTDLEGGNTIFYIKNRFKTFSRCFKTIRV